MTANSIRREIERLVQQLAEEGLAIDYNMPKIDGSTVKTVVWAGYRKAEKHPFASLAAYRWMIDNRQFTAILADGSLLQLMYSFRRSTLVKHRLCYYPFPYSIEPEELDEYLSSDYGILEVLDDIASGDQIERFRLHAPIRFDYDRDNTSQDHPASHVHISSNDCRIPVFAPISIGHFVQFVLAYLHFADVPNASPLRSWPVTWFTRTLETHHDAMIHVECRQRLA